MNGWLCSLKHGPGYLRCWKTFSSGWYEAFQKHSNLWLGRAPQTRPSFIHGVEEPFRFDVLQPIKHIQVHGWARSPTSPVTVELILWRCKIVSFWCCADFQQRSNERMVVLSQKLSRSIHGVKNSFHLHGMKLFKKARTYGWAVLPRTRSSCFHGVENSFFLVGKKFFKNIRTYGWAVLPQTRPIFFHGVEEPFGVDVMQPLKHIQVHGWAALPNILCHGPAHFAALKNHFVLMLCRLSTLFQWTDGRAPPNTVWLSSQCWKLISSGWYETFHKHSNLWLGRAPPNTAQFLSRWWKTVSSDIMQPSKHIQVHGWAAFHKHPLSRPRSFCGVEESFRFVILQTFNDVQMNGWSCPPKHSPVVLTVFVYFFLDGMKLFKNIRTYGWAVFIQTRPSFFHGVEEPFRLDVMQPCKNIQVYGWAALSNIPCHGPAHFAALKNHVFLVLCKLSTTFKWRDGRAPPNTVPLVWRCWRIFSFGWFIAFQKRSNLWLDRAPPNTAQFLPRCWRTFSSGCYAAV